jgi:hypothetical protein
MTEIDTSKIKPGDVVTVRAEVIEIWPGALHIKAPTGAKVWMARQDIATHEPAPLKIGDVVIYHDSSKPCSIIGLYGNKAWLEYLGETWCVVNVKDLRRVDQP